MTSSQPHDRESLSALFDGELHGDAARFVHKRLAQDPQWRQACGTWQLAGDVLRGQATAAAPPGFADQVQRALAREAEEAPIAPAAGAAPRRGWVGGAALAASVAVAAWFVASPFDEPVPSAAPATVVTTTPAPAAPVAAAPLPSSPRVAAIEPATREARQPRRVPSRSAARPTNASASAPRSIAASGIGNAGIDPAALVEDPFRLPRPPVAVTRPWPRAVLPDYPVGGELTARYRGPSQNADASAADSPTFYPFEPRLPPDAGAPSDMQRR